ncbi:hypothetical protein Tsubulata_007073 [Turnera subulata]|uniref:HVA22-like protein n=1 Tax=Turnera subulata TaxID=218843 RepID=A0A9Q0GHL2_9ROSI|nr:hypothetical protein Tsubulata_007073 [Turnera subulata]
MAFFPSEISDVVLFVFFFLRWGFNCCFAHSIPTLSSVQHVVLWGSVYPFTPHSRLSNTKTKPSNRNGFSIGLVAYGSFSLVEVFTDKLVSWIPYYYHIKFAFLVWLQLPSVNGAKQLYMSHLRPFLLRHQARLDLIVEFLHGETNKFISTNHGEFQFAKALVIKTLSSVNQMVRGATPPGGRRENGATEGMTSEMDNSSESLSDDED